MENLVPLGTGNSRLMKSNIPSNTTLAQLIQMWNNGTFPYDIGPLNSAGISQQGTPLNKDTLLKDATAALYGLTNTAVPDDVLAYLGKYNQYWWRRIPSAKYVIDDSLPLSNLRIFMATSADNDNHYTTYYDSITIDQDIGTVSPSGRSRRVMVNYKNADTTAAKLRGKYVYNNNATSGTLYYVPTNAEITKDDNYAGGYAVFIQGMQVVTKLVQDANVDYVYSADRNAYPDSGNLEGYEYQYLGIPFENAREAPKIATGSYVGTGTSGASSPNSLTLDFEPKLVIVGDLIPARYSSGEWSNSFIWTSGQTYTYITGNEYAVVTLSLIGFTLKWFASSNTVNAANQCNTLGTVYRWTAIG